MQIPLDAKDWKRVYIDATSQGVKITSRYMGVYAKKNGKALVWSARYQGDGVEKFLGNFPFNKDGEVNAAKAYEAYKNNLIRNDILPTKRKGRVMKSKIALK